MSNKVLQHEEVDIDSALVQAIDSIADKKSGIIRSFGRMYQYYDDPKFYQYFAVLATASKTFTGDHGTTAGFSFFSRRLAVLKCLGEAVERYAVEHRDHAPLVFAQAARLDTPALDIRSIANFSEHQRTQHGWVVSDPNASYSWVLGRSLPANDPVYIPAQLVYLLYKRRKGEPLLRLPVSTGAAAGTSLAASIYRGMCEIIERDAFMVTYLNKLPRSRVALERSHHPRIRRLLEVAANYNIELYLFDISTDLEAYTFLAVALDRTGIGPAVATGLKSGLNPLDAMLGALQEVFHPRTWLRREMEEHHGGREELTTPVFLYQRGVLWADRQNIKQLDFLLVNASPVRTVESYATRSLGSTSQDVHYLVEKLRARGYHSYYVDITPNIAAVRHTAFKVVMVIIPELQPMHLDERHPYLGGERLYQMPVTLGYKDRPSREEELNPFPHPFL